MLPDGMSKSVFRYLRKLMKKLALLPLVLTVRHSKPNLPVPSSAAVKLTVLWPVLAVTAAGNIRYSGSGSSPGVLVAMSSFVSALSGPPR